MAARVVFFGEWWYHDAQSGAVYRHHFRNPAITRGAAQSLPDTSFVTECTGAICCALWQFMSAGRPCASCVHHRPRSLGGGTSPASFNVRCDIPPFDEQRFLLTWKFILLYVPQQTRNNSMLALSWSPIDVRVLYGIMMPF